MLNLYKLKNSFFAAGLGFGQPAPFQLIGSNAGKVGLDIEDGGSIQHVETADVQNRSFPTKQLDDGQTQRVGALGRARGEDSVGPVIGRRSAEQFETARTIELPDNEEVRKALDIGEAEFKFGQNSE